MDVALVEVEREERNGGHWFLDRVDIVPVLHDSSWV
jgi:hypothetical protein